MLGEKMTGEELQWINFLSSIIQNSFLQHSFYLLKALNCWAKVYCFLWSNLQASPGRKAPWHLWQVWQILCHQESSRSWVSGEAVLHPSLLRLKALGTLKIRKYISLKKINHETDLFHLWKERDCSSFFSANKEVFIYISCRLLHTHTVCRAAWLSLCSRLNCSEYLLPVSANHKWCASS